MRALIEFLGSSRVTIFCGETETRLDIWAKLLCDEVLDTRILYD